MDRWDRLFAEVESAATEAHADERDALARDLVDQQWAAVGWRDLLGGNVVLDVEGLGQVDGPVRYAGDLVVIDRGGPWLAIVPEAVLAVSSADGRSAPPPPMRRDRRQFALMLVAEEAPVRMVRRDGRSLIAVVRVAGSDFVQVESAGRAVSLPWSAVASIASV